MVGKLMLPLTDLRILDLTTVIFGPYTTQMLGDFGADVIKIEPPDGDLTRHLGPGRSPGMSSLYLGCNRNKRSVILDLKREPAKRALWRLIESADAIVHNVRPQKMAALGFAPDPVMACNSKIVYGGLHGYWEDGPYGGRPAFDDVIQGESGIAGTFMARDGEPELMPTIVADKTAALLASTGLIAALLQRFRTDKGVYLETSMFEGMVAYTLLEHQHGTIFDPKATGAGYPRALSPSRRPHRTSDGYICMLAYTDDQWHRFWSLADKAELVTDPRFDSLSNRSNNIDVLYSLAGEVLTTRSTKEWLDVLGDADIPAGPVNRLDDLRDDPHLKATGFFRSYEHPSEGRLEILDTAFRFNRQALPVRLHQPRLGEHSRQVLDEAGFSDSEINEILDL
jgi:crotonobetainyl-CoA:carnitine CoA-transferase CaiB-like acyl-CoA transferase